MSYLALTEHRNIYHISIFSLNIWGYDLPCPILCENDINRSRSFSGYFNWMMCVTHEIQPSHLRYVCHTGSMSALTCYGVPKMKTSGWGVCVCGSVPGLTFSSITAIKLCLTAILLKISLLGKQLMTIDFQIWLGK